MGRLDSKSNSKTKDNLHKTNNALWNELVVYIRQNLIPEILYYEDFIFEIPDRITFNIEETEETKKLVNASEKDLQEVEKIGPAKAKQIKDVVEKEYKEG